VLAASCFLAVLAACQYKDSELEKWETGEPEAQHHPQERDSRPVATTPIAQTWRTASSATSRHVVLPRLFTFG
jgi:hypothetical protein